MYIVFLKKRKKSYLTKLLESKYFLLFNLQMKYHCANEKVYFCQFYQEQQSVQILQ